MTEKDKAIIAEKRAQIKALELEIAELEDKSIGSFIRGAILEPIDGTIYGVQKQLRPNRAGTSAWRLIVNASMEIYRKRVRSLGIDLRQQNLTKSQKQTAAKLCDEMIEAYNKFMIYEYAEEYAVPREYISKYAVLEEKII